MAVNKNKRSAHFHLGSPVYQQKTYKYHNSYYNPHVDDAARMVSGSHGDAFTILGFFYTKSHASIRD